MSLNLSNIDVYSDVYSVTGALLREKMVEAAAGKFVCIVDESKLSSNGLGPGFPLPVEITPFCHEHTRRVIEALPALKGTKYISSSTGIYMQLRCLDTFKGMYYVVNASYVTIQLITSVLH